MQRQNNPNTPPVTPNDQQANQQANLQPVDPRLVQFFQSASAGRRRGISIPNDQAPIMDEPSEELRNVPTR